MSINNQRIPCGGFYLDASLKLTDDNKLGVAGGGIYKLIFKNVQVGQSSYEWHFAEDSDIQSYAQLKKIAFVDDTYLTKGNIFVDNANNVWYSIENYYNNMIIAKRYSIYISENSVLNVGTDEFSIKPDNTISCIQKSVNLTQST